MLSEWLPFGVLGRPHGMAGEIALDLFNRTAAQGSLPTPLDVQLIRGSEVRRTVITSSRAVHAGLLLRFVDVESREAAAAFTGFELSVPRAVLAPLKAGEFYLADLVGCDVVQMDGTPVGRVSGTFWNGAQDVLSVVDSDGVEHLVPAVAPYVQSFDPSVRRLVVDYHE